MATPEPRTEPPAEKEVGPCARRYCGDPITTRQEAVTYHGQDYHRECAVHQLADDKVIELTDGASIYERDRYDARLNRRGA